MAKKSFVPGAIGVLNSAKYEIAKEGNVDLEGIYNKENSITRQIEKKEKKL